MYLVQLFKKIIKMIIKYETKVDGKTKFNSYERKGTGWNIRITNGTIEVNGERIASNVVNKVNIDVENGVIAELITDGSVKCEDVIGDVDAGGSVTAKKISGSVDAGGSVNVAGGVGGKVDAGGSVNIIN